MVNVLINEIQNTISVFYFGPYSESGSRQEEQHEFSMSEVDFYFSEYGNRWILEKKLGLNEFEHHYIFNFPADDIYIKYIRDEK